MNHRRSLDRHQTLLLPEWLEDYIAADNPVRFLDAFVGTLNLRALGFAKATVQKFEAERVAGPAQITMCATGIPQSLGPAEFTTLASTR